MQSRTIPKEQVELLYEQNIPGQKGPKAKPLVMNPRYPLEMKPEVVECIIQGLKEAGETMSWGIVFHSDGNRQSIDDGFSVDGGVYHIMNDIGNPFAFHVEYTNYNEVDEEDEEIEVPDEAIEPGDSPLVKRYKKIRNEKLTAFLQIIKTCTAKIQTRVGIPKAAESMEKQRVTTKMVKEVAEKAKFPPDVEQKLGALLKQEKLGGRRKTKKSKKSKRKTRKIRR